MLVSKPKRSAIFALFFFLLLIFAAIGGLVYAVLEYGTAWYILFGIVILSPVAVAVLLKVMASNKVLTFSKENLLVHFPLRFSKKRYLWKDLKGWQQVIIQTKSSDFKVIELYFIPKLKVSFSHAENSDYNEVYALMKKRFGKIEVRPKPKD